MESHKKKKIVIAVMISGLLCVAAGIGWFGFNDSKRFVTLPKEMQNPRIEDISGMGKGSITVEDTYLIVENKPGLRYSNYFKVIPGKCIFFTESKGKMETLRGDAQIRQKYYWKSVQTNIYDITSGELVQGFDVKKIVKEHAPGYQIDGRRNAQVFSGKNGHLFFRWYLTDIPEDGKQEEEGKYLCMDYETGKFYLEDSKKTLYDDTEQQQNFEKQFSINDRKAFMEKNNYTGFEYGESDERAFYYTYYSSVNGIAYIDITATALPKENEALYSRFPGLQEYQGEEDKTVKIYLGGYPTIEEIQQLFVEEGTEGAAGE